MKCLSDEFLDVTLFYLVHLRDVIEAEFLINLDYSISYFLSQI